MKVISLMVDFLKIVKLWHLSSEFYGEWQLLLQLELQLPLSHYSMPLQA